MEAEELFIDKILENYQTKLPNYIKLLFKIYYRNPSLFKIADGHKKLLLHLKEICTKEVENISNKFCSSCNKTNNPKEKNQKKRNFHDMQREAEEIMNKDTWLNHLSTMHQDFV